MVRRRDRARARGRGAARERGALRAPVGGAFEGIAVTEDGRVRRRQRRSSRRCSAATLADLIGRPVRDFVAAERPRDRERAHWRAASEEPVPAPGDAAPTARSFPWRCARARCPTEGARCASRAVRDVSARVRGRGAAAASRKPTCARRPSSGARPSTPSTSASCSPTPRGAIVRLNRGALDLAAGRAFAELRRAQARRARPSREPWRTLLDLHRAGRREPGRRWWPRRATRANGRSFYLLGSPWFRGEGETPWRVLTFRDVTEFTNMQAPAPPGADDGGDGLAGGGGGPRGAQPALQHLGHRGRARERARQRGRSSPSTPVLLRSQVGRLTQLMRDLLDYGKPSAAAARADAPGRRGAARRPLLRDAGPRAAGRAWRRIVPATCPRSTIDGARMEQALENLLANAIQHAPAGLGGAAWRGRARRRRRGAARSAAPWRTRGRASPPRAWSGSSSPSSAGARAAPASGCPIVQRVAEAHGGDVSAPRTGRRRARASRSSCPWRSPPTGGRPRA